MPKVYTLVPLVHPKTGETFGAGTTLDVDDEVFAAWRADGKVADVAAAEAQASTPGHFSERTGREDTTSTKPSSRSKG